MCCIKIDNTLAQALLIGAVLAFYVADAEAQRSGSGSSTIRGDLNGDGEIAWSEIVEQRTKAFSRLDRNRDGYVDQLDRPRFGFGRRFDEAFNQLKARYDSNSDQRISRTELIDGQEPMFEMGDINHDGVLSAEEIAALRTDVAN